KKAAHTRSIRIRARRKEQKLLQERKAKASFQGRSGDDFFTAMVVYHQQSTTVLLTGGWGYNMQQGHFHTTTEKLLR
ncbi:unnamed protein product, partial [Heterosigma akashiwo]